MPRMQSAPAPNLTRHGGPGTARILLAATALLVPRFALAYLWYNTSWIAYSFGSDNLVWPVVGLTVLPWTCIAYWWAIVIKGTLEGLWAAVLVVGLVADVLSLGLARVPKKRRRDRRITR